MAGQLEPGRGEKMRALPAAKCSQRASGRRVLIARERRQLFKGQVRPNRGLARAFWRALAFELAYSKCAPAELAEPTSCPGRSHPFLHSRRRLWVQI